uniref:WxxW domain-containing protein n=1 Tax=Knipowitschia caucasica TaxID=637954 RepID=A0AAV2J814_KNICA
MDTVTGFVCKRSDQDDSECEDYKVRFLCPEEFCQPQDDSDSGDGAPSGHMCKNIRMCVPIESECNWQGISIELEP